MNAPEIINNDIVAELPPSKGNPRNSEGDFEKLKDGSILFGYCRYHGTSAADDDDCDIAGLISHDEGRTFSETPLLAKASDHGVKNIMSVSLERLKNGQLVLFYLCKSGKRSKVYLRRANDDESAFGKPELCVGLKKDTYYVLNNCRILQNEDGSVLMPLAVHSIYKKENGEEDINYVAKAKIFKSDENCENFRPLGKTFELKNAGHSETGFQEPGLCRLKNGDLYIHFRTDLGFQYESISSDDGKTWSPELQSKFTSPASPMLIRKNPFDQLYYAFWNPIPNYNGRLRNEGGWIHAGRNPLVMAVSENGTDFSDYTVIESDPDHGFCYPAVFFTSEKELLLSYCCGGREDGNCLAKTRIRKITLA